MNNRMRTLRFQRKTPRPVWLLALLMIVGMVLTACVEQVEVAPRLKLAGSTTVEPVALAAAKAFMVTHEGVEVTVRGGGSSIGVLGVTHGALHIGMTSRSLKASELQELPALTPTVIGRDGVAVVMNRSVYDAGVTQLTLAQVRDIWLGRITNWRELGGPDLPILAFDKELGRGTRDVFAGIVLGDADAEAPGTIGSLGENEMVLTTISENEGAISILSTGWVTNEVVGVAIVSDDGEVIEPTQNNVATGRYPLTRDLNLVTNGRPQGIAAEFINFLLSPQGQNFVELNGYTPIVQEGSGS